MSPAQMSKWKRLLFSAGLSPTWLRALPLTPLPLFVPGKAKRLLTMLLSPGGTPPSIAGLMAIVAMTAQIARQKQLATKIKLLFPIAWKAPMPTAPEGVSWLEVV